jgi:hypothetical protein
VSRSSTPWRASPTLPPGRPVTSHTPFYNYSIGKGAASTLAFALTKNRLTQDFNAVTLISRLVK